MPRTGRAKAELILSADEREQLTRYARRATSAQSLALRSKIVLACADGADNKSVAEDLRCSLWARFDPRSVAEGYRRNELPRPQIRIPAAGFLR